MHLKRKTNGTIEVIEVVNARGHQMIRSTHKTTFEITKDPSLTWRGDCIVAVAADKGVLDFNPEFKKYIRRKEAELIIKIKVEDIIEVVKAKGDPRLTLTHPRDIVIRKSSHVCGRTLAVRADKAAIDISRKVVERLKKPQVPVTITFTVKVKENA
ncbi:TPA: DUF371 domain-containing protein [Candidatus Bathyarchaeota archaeon]|nr:DUF371 domain-containing protein [Candidatus Bathyarchaeota archaeon]